MKSPAGDTPSPQELIGQVPEFAGLARSATLLRPSAGAPGPHDSSVGGPFLWPSADPWPVCRAPRLVRRREKLSDRDRELWQEADRRTKERRQARGGGAYEVTEEDARTQERIMAGAGALDMVTWERIRTVSEPHDTPPPLIPVLQLFSRDVPGLPFPPGTDLLQLMWCPDDHAEPPGQPRYWGPDAGIMFRSSAAAGTDRILEPPRPDEAKDGYVPAPCVLDPLGAVDLPEEDELPEELAETALTWAEDHGADYARTLGCLPGWKAGGWPSWHLTDFVPLDCACGARMRLHLTLDSGGDPGLNVGRFGELRVFVCPSDITHPLRLNIQ
ncbi:hypothetical protein [Streptomyces sp. NPDC093094]|uniref:hypothetical protein n=1 Tax=Streptomyces sp. NPDC093094 TaxID=3366026 RepID=UPI00382E1F2A